MQLQVQNNQGFAPVTLDEAMKFSEMLARSTMVPRQYQGKAEDVLVACQWGKEIGLAPMQALQNIAVINGKPSVYGDAAMALVQASSVCEDIEEYFEGEGTPNPVAICVAHRKGRKPVKATFSVEDAKRAGPWGKQGPWTAYPKRMMQMRARGFALRDAFPDVLKGLITAEEAQDYPEAKDVTPARQKLANPLDALPAPVKPHVTAAPVTPQPAHVRGTWSDEAEAHIAEANSVAAEVFTDVSEDVEEVMPDHTDVAHDTTAWMLAIPGRDAIEQPDMSSYIQAYKEMIDKIASAGKAPAKLRLDKIKELRDANEATLHRIPAIDRVQITAHLAKYQGTLEEKLKEEIPK